MAARAAVTPGARRGSSASNAVPVSESAPGRRYRGICAHGIRLKQAEIRLATTLLTAAQYLFDQQLIQLKLNRMHMLTEALRSLVMRVAWEHDHKLHSANPGLAMNFSTDVIQEVTELNLDVHAGAGVFEPRADKLVRDGIIWSHLAGDSVQRMKATRRLAR